MNARVVWIHNGKSFPVHECYDKPYGVCRDYVKKHAGDSQYAGGKLAVYSVIPGVN